MAILKWPLLKWPLSFQKFSTAVCPGPSGAFFCSSTCFKLILQEKSTLEKMSKFGAPFLKKISDYALDMKHLERAYSHPFSRLDVHRFCIYSSEYST